MNGYTQPLNVLSMLDLVIIDLLFHVLFFHFFWCLPHNLFVVYELMRFMLICITIVVAWIAPNVCKDNIICFGLVTKQML
jgi:hypothetical protein